MTDLGTRLRDFAEKAGRDFREIYARLDTLTASASGVSSVNGRTGTVTLAQADVGLGSVDNTADTAKAVLSASKLTTPRTINGVSFDGSANVTIPGSSPAVVAKSATYSETTTSGDLLILCTGTFTINLPTAVGNSARITAKLLSGAVTLDPAGAETIDGAATAVVNAADAAITIASDGTNWRVV